MNYIKHLNQWMALSYVDDRLSPHHQSIYITLFQFWNKSRFSNSISICRNEVMQGSKVGSTRTYYKCIKELHDFGYIIYTPSRCAMTGSKVSMVPLEDIEVDKMIDGSEDTGEASGPVDPGSVFYQENLTKTGVSHSQKVHSCCSKNDTCENHQVTPLFINNKNYINRKEREGRALNQVKNNIGLYQGIPEGKKRDRRAIPKIEGENQKLAIFEYSERSKQNQALTSGTRLERKDKVPRKFSKPSLEEVRDFFINQLNGKYASAILENCKRKDEADKFFYHYESVGWLVGGKAPMQNWKSACHSWVVKIPYYNRERAKKSSFAQNKNFNIEYDRHYGKPL